MNNSRKLFNRAKMRIAGGVNSPARAFSDVGGEPVFFTRGEGAYLFDADGKKYIDANSRTLLSSDSICPRSCRCCGEEKPIPSQNASAIAATKTSALANNNPRPRRNNTFITANPRY